MAGIYIHVPFCRKACHYCNFHFSTNLSYVDRMIDAMYTEISSATYRLKNERIDSIYFGGGTPSLLKPHQIAKFIRFIYQNYEVSATVEITLEANPEDIKAKYCHDIVEAGVNRISLGIQSFFDHDLTFMNRAHDSDQGKDAIEHIRTAGIENLAVDLMFGLIQSDLEQWQKNLEELISYHPEHISCYNLTIEEQTAFHKWQEQGKIRSPREHMQFDQFLLAHDMLGAIGYEHYEISNFCKPGFQSIHNTNYWTHGSYVGIGPGAHSFWGTTRVWNPANNMIYIEHVNQLALIQEQEELSETNLYNETIMLGLRQSKGVQKADILKFSEVLREHFHRKIKSLADQRALVDELESISLTIDQWYLSDYISGQLFYD